jgi:hypothetical protein
MSDTTAASRNVLARLMRGACRHRVLGPPQDGS